MSRPELTHDFLRQEYIDSQKSLQTLASETGWAISTLCKHLRKHGISKMGEGVSLSRKDSTRRLTRAFLSEEYVVSRKTTYQIAKECGVSPSSVQYKLKKYGIPVRGNDDYAECLEYQTFGLLMVTSETKKKIVRGRSRTFYLCRCECGLNKWIRRDRLISGSNISCGCEELKNRVGIGDRSWTGFGEISGGYWAGITGRARRSGKPLTITIEYAWNLFESQNRMCALTGYPITIPPVSP